MILTIGHSNLSQAEFLALLKQHDVVTLIDVRSKPYSSYSPHFSKRELESAVNSIGVRYQWEGRMLGGLDAINCADPEFVKAMENVLSLQELGSVCLMCSEKNPAACHRASKLTAWIHTHYSPEQVSTAHITPHEVTDARTFQSQQKPGWSELESRTEQLKLDIS